MNLSLRAEAIIRRPERISVRSRQPLLGDLHARWAFRPSPAGAHVDFLIALTPASAFGAGLARYLMEKSAARTLRAFSNRAAALYSPRWGLFAPIASAARRRAVKMSTGKGKTMVDDLSPAIAESVCR